MGYYDDCLEHHGILGQKWGVRRFQKPDGSLTEKGKKRYLNEVKKDMESHFKSNISKEAAKVSGINRNGTVSQDQAWGQAYRKGKVTDKDDAQVKKAAKEAYKYAESKYGKETMNALKRSGVLGRPIDDFNPSTTKAGKDLLDNMLGVNKDIDRAQKRLDKVTAKLKKTGTAWDNDSFNNKKMNKYRKVEKKYYKELGKVQKEYDTKNTGGMNDYAHYKITGRKKEG